MWVQPRWTLLDKPQDSQQRGSSLNSKSLFFPFSDPSAEQMEAGPNRPEVWLKGVPCHNYARVAVTDNKEPVLCFMSDVVAGLIARIDRQRIHSKAMVFALTFLCYGLEPCRRGKTRPNLAKSARLAGTTWLMHKGPENANDRTDLRNRDRMGAPAPQATTLTRLAVGDLGNG